PARGPAGPRGRASITREGEGDGRGIGRLLAAWSPSMEASRSAIRDPLPSEPLEVRLLPAGPASLSHRQGTPSRADLPEPGQRLDEGDRERPPTHRQGVNQADREPGQVSGES